MNTELWPPLSVIRSAFQAGGAAPAVSDAAGPEASRAVVAMPGTAPAAAAAPPRAVLDLLLPLTELARRREAVAQRAFTARWAPGRLVSVVHEGRLLGVLLDRCIHGNLWQGWMAAGEADWAGAYDVLLEPDDEPFEPAFGLVQAWNVLTLEPSPQLCARVLGEISATRLAAIRAVHDEWAAQAPLAIAPEPGHIALRTVGGVFSVLSGTPLGAQDPRADYQALYRDAASQLSTALQPGSNSAPAAPGVARAKPHPGPEGGWWGGIRRWFGAEGWVRPAFAVLALVVVVQNTGLLGQRAEDDEVRFRSAPPPAAASAQLVVRWKPDARAEDTARLLQSISADVVGGPGADGTWRLRVPDRAQGLAALAASPLVASAGPAPERP
ncbi:hypothetical protein [Variovorax sp. DXTD-1]|uniref:hypothetical protein n=1 Tax=Variovorax sp. DXTD-1 TaxID=2495592 RepID=UPI000F874FCF|nr:hypothetical protein [Variovorax sp. DXTD-1]RST46418.1 hypothetical protein EJI00_21390 [Variovorax sp. DXTD-1]